MRKLPLVHKGIASTLVTAALLAWGCDANHVLGVADGGPATGTAGVGGHTAPANGGSSGGQAGQATTPVDASTGPEVGPLGPSQTWTGYVENFMFPSGSDALTVTVAADAQGNTVGTITLGHGTPPAPATDPNIGYPPSLETNSMGGAGVIATAINFYAEGYPYAFDQGALTSQRIKFAANLNQMWAGWCSLETEAGDSGTCLPNTGGMASGQGNSCAYGDPNNPGKYIPVDCGKFALCGLASVCTCTASGCSLNSSMGGIVSLDIAINGGTANGSLEGPFGNQSVQLTKSP